MTNYDNILETTSSRLKKAIHHLEYSYNKVQQLPINYSEMDDEIMETWESFSSRFGRAADIFMMKYIRTLILCGDPGFQGTLRDRLNKAEKMRIIADATQWLEIRELRNVAAHEYHDDDLTAYYKKLLEYAPIILELKNTI